MRLGWVGLACLDVRDPLYCAIDAFPDRPEGAPEKVHGARVAHPFHVPTVPIHSDPGGPNGFRCTVVAVGGRGSCGKGRGSGVGRGGGSCVQAVGHVQKHSPPRLDHLLRRSR